MRQALEESVSHTIATALKLLATVLQSFRDVKLTDITRVHDTESILASHSSAIYS